ncbi:MAG: VOC family protein [Betaproteobacteria bacterium]|nr:MAG: VOC family protein [Betaproteobacteria bacterium]
MSALKLTFLSHGTLEARELDKTRQFYEECLGLETIRTSPISLMIRLGGDNTIAVVQNPKKGEMALLNHNGLDVATRAEVDECHRILSEGKEKWGLKKVTKPADQHGTYSFYFSDLDDNWWEILTNPAGGYSWMFSQGRDLAAWGAGKGDAVNPNEYKQRGKEITS